MPLTFENENDYDAITQDDELVLSNVFEGLTSGKITVKNKPTGKEIKVNCQFTKRQSDILLAGGLLNYTKEGGQ